MVKQRTTITAYEQYNILIAILINLIIIYITLRSVDFLERIRKFLAKYGAQLNSFVAETKCARFPFRITDIIRAAASSRS